MKHNAIRGVVVASALAGIVGASAILASVLPASATAAHGTAGKAALASVTTPQSGPGGKITIEVVAVNGSGCPAGTASVDPSADNTSFTVTYKAFVARDGANSDPTDARKNCQLGILVHYPQGFTFAIAQADYHGYALLHDGATAMQRTNYYFQGESDGISVSHDFSGPFTGSWTRTDATPVESLVWAPCGAQRVLNLNESLRVDNSGATSHSTSVIAMGRSDGSVQTVFHVSWKSCP